MMKIIDASSLINISDSIIISLGSNMGDRLAYLQQAQSELSQYFQIESASPIVESKAVDYKNQNDFLNQILEVKLKPEFAKLSLLEIMQTLLGIEKKMLRVRDQNKGPRTIDLDIIMVEDYQVNHPQLQLPHPSYHLRDFIVSPLKELPFFQRMRKCVKINPTQDSKCWLYQNKK